MNFSDFHFHPKVAAAVKAAGYAAPTPIQEQAIPLVLQGRDVMGLAQTGTGKTAVFALPILHRLMERKPGAVRALIISPTRELAEQTHRAFEDFGRRTHLGSMTLYGGVGPQGQVQRLRRGTEIVVACPGRLLDHIRQGNIDLSGVEVLVLDEADQMFDMGFFPDVRRILAHLPGRRQTLLFSATMPEQIRSLAGEVLRNPVTVQVGRSAPAETVSHALFPVPAHLKTPLLMELLRQTDTGPVLVFTRTKHRAKRLGEQLARSGFPSACLQGNLSQSRRQAALDGFRDGTFRILVATDIAARGIDVQKVSHVINYDIPNTPEAYIHRIGRTGRASRTGDAFTFVTGEDTDMIRAIDRVIGEPVERRTLDAFNYHTPAPALALAGTDARPRDATPYGSVQARRPSTGRGYGSRPRVGSPSVPSHNRGSRPARPQARAHASSRSPR